MQTNKNCFAKAGIWITIKGTHKALQGPYKALERRYKALEEPCKVLSGLLLLLLLLALLLLLLFFPQSGPGWGVADGLGGDGNGMSKSLGVTLCAAFSVFAA